MSLKTIVQSVLKAIGRVWVKLKPQIQKAVHTGILVVEAVKAYDTANPMIGDIITSLIPGEADDFVKLQLRKGLPTILSKLKLVDRQFTDEADAEQFVLEVIKEIQQLTGVERRIALDSLSQLVTDVAADKKIDWDDLAYINKYYYDNIYRTKPAQ